MKRLLWIALAAAMLLAGCGGSDHNVPEADDSPHTGRPVSTPEERDEPDETEDPGDGAPRDRSDPDAPKVIVSTDITGFSCWFSTLDAGEPGVLGNKIYRLEAEKKDGAVTGKYAVLDQDWTERSFSADAAFLEELQGLVELFELAEHNGHNHEVAGLPGDYGARLDVEYASGEAIHAYDNQENFLSYGAMDALVKLFERGAAVTPETLALSVSTQYAMEPLTEGYGAVRYPVYLLEAEGHDGLSAALAGLNEAHTDGAAGEMDYFRSEAKGELYYLTDACVTRADSEVISCYERTSRYESAGWNRAMTDYRTHNLEASTGRELGFSDVFRDMEYLPYLIAMEIESAYPEQTFYDDMTDFIRQSVERNDGNICFALGYGCVHIFANEYILNDEPGGQHITLSYVLNPYQLRAMYMTAPDRWLLPLDYDTVYWNNSISLGFRMHWYEEPESADGWWEVALDGADAEVYEESFYGYAPSCFLAHADGRDYIYLRVPVGDVSMLTNIYEISQRGLKALGQVHLAMQTDSPLLPDGMRMSLDTPVYYAYGIMVPYGTYRVGANGMPEAVGDVYGLEGPWVSLRESGRYNPDDRENAAVSGGMWTLVAGELLRPYQTDLQSWIDFITEDGRVVRFEINEFSETMQLDNFGGLEDVFAPQAVG